jgi:hypothetical protein
VKECAKSGAKNGKCVGKCAENGGVIGLGIFKSLLQNEQVDGVRKILCL